jgi:hypothetical protein
MPNIRHAITINAPPKLVHPLVSSGRGFTEWWAEDVEKDNFSGVVELGFFDRATVYRLQLIGSTAPTHTEWLCQSGKEWQNTKLVFELAESKNGTLLRFAHADWQDETDYFISCNTTWGELMYRLKAVAEGKKPGPLFSKNGLAYCDTSEI